MTVCHIYLISHGCLLLLLSLLSFDVCVCVFVFLVVFSSRLLLAISGKQRVAEGKGVAGSLVFHVLLSLLLRFG